MYSISNYGFQSPKGEDVCWWQGIKVIKYKNTKRNKNKMKTKPIYHQLPQKTYHKHFWLNYFKFLFVFIQQLHLCLKRLYLMVPVDSEIFESILSTTSFTFPFSQLRVDPVFLPSRQLEIYHPFYALQALFSG